MSTESLKSFYQRAVEVLNRGDLDQFFTFLHPDYIYHNVDLPNIHTIEDYKPHLASFFAAFPGIQFFTDDMVAEGTVESGKLAIRSTYRVQPKFPLPGIPADHFLEFSAINIYQIIDSKCIEEWDSNNIVHILDKLGFVQQI